MFWFLMKRYFTTFVIGNTLKVRKNLFQKTKSTFNLKLIEKIKELKFYIQKKKMSFKK